MAQDGPHDHQHTASSDEPSLVPPIVTSPSPAENDNGGSSRTGSLVSRDASKGKDVFPNAIQGGEHGLASGGRGNGNASRSKGKGLALGVAAAGAAGDGFPKGKSSLAAADDDGDLKVHIIMERERRKQMKDLFSSLHALMPHVPKKVDKATLVGETIHYIRALEQKKIHLEKRKQGQALARQVAAEAAASSLSMPHTAQGMAAMSDGWGPVPQQQPSAAAPAPTPFAAAVGPVGFQSWSAPNIVLSVTNDEAIINVCVPRQSRMLTLVLSVLNKHGIDVITAQVVADGAQSFFTFYTRVNGAGAENPLAEDIYKVAVSEIIVLLSS